MKSKNKEKNLLFKISSLYINKTILSYIPEITYLNIIKYNKRLQKLLDFSLYSYQKKFIENKIFINFNKILPISSKLTNKKNNTEKKKKKDDLPSTKIKIEEFMNFIQKEFNNFDKKNDIKILENIINEIRKEKEKFKYILFDIEETKIFEEDKKFKLPKDLNNLIELNLLYNNLDNINFKKYNKRNLNKYIIPSGTFPNLKTLKTTTKFIIPSSIMTNLEKLFIYLIPKEKLLFLNDIGQKEIDIENLKILKIYRDYCFSDENSLEITEDLEDKNENILYEEEHGLTDSSEEDDDGDGNEESNENEDEGEDEDGEEGDDDEDKNEDNDKDKELKKDKKKEKLDKENEIKFNFTKLETLSIEILRIEDYSFLKDYFNFDFIYNELKGLKNNSVEVYNHLKQKFLNLQLMESLNYFELKFILVGYSYSVSPFFRIKKYKNGLKKYCFYMDADLENGIALFCEEKYEENEKKEKILKYYANVNGFDVGITSLDKLNVIKLRDKGKKLRLDKDKIKNLFNILNDNYSVQEISLCIKDFDETNLEKISKFKVLRKLVIKNSFKNKNCFIKFVKDISELPLLNIIILSFRGKLSKKEKQSIKKLLPESSIETKGKVLKINQNYENYDITEFL